MVDAKARNDCIKEIDLLKVCVCVVCVPRHVNWFVYIHYGCLGIVLVLPGDQ